MTDGWLVLAVVAAIVICSGFIVAAAIMRTAWIRKERESLTSEDLRAVEESAMLLIEQLKSEADQALTEMEKRSERLQELIVLADDKLTALHSSIAELDKTDSVAGLQMHASEPNDGVGNYHQTAEKVLHLASSGMDCTEIAKTVGIDRAEVRLILGLGKLAAG